VTIADEEINEKKSKLGTFDGVFMPTSLNVLSILMFLRFGFIIGQMGILGSFVLLFMSYAIDLLTTLSISAIATNGTVRGGGAYYMISRSLGPEFGGSIGLVFYVGQVLNSGLNVVGFIEPFLNNLGEKYGLMANIFPQGYWWEFLYSSVLLFLCICVALVGSTLVSKAGGILFVLLIVSTLSVPISTIFVRPFEVPEFGLFYSGPTWATFKGNLMPHFTKGAAGSQTSGKETFNSMFGIFFPATAGIFAGASMSGDLRKPSKSIPKGTLWGLLLTFCMYSLVILSLGAAVPRKLLHKDVQIVQSVNLSGMLVLVGEFSTCLFSVIVGIVGAANVLQAIAKDEIFPELGVFSKVDEKSGNPIPAILLTWFLTQLCLFANVNQIATFITMAFLMTFIVTNLACFLLKIASAPNFRPSFKYFDWYTAFAALVSCFIAMFIVDGIYASLMIIFLLLLFIFIHYVCPPKSWGDVSQSLIYHQVRKYLLRLRQDNVKYWRPQILLLVDSPRSSWNLIQFCNNLKKGGLYILGHVIITESFQTNFAELKKQEQAWLKLRDLSKIKAFVQIGLGPTLPWGVRNVILGSGLGGMKPNIVVLGYFDMDKHYPLKRPSITKKKTSSHTSLDVEQLPTDECRNEKRVSIQNWVSIIEDMILMRTNIAIAKGFEHLNIPKGKGPKKRFSKREFIDLYPIQMSAEVFDKNGERSALTTNFDTYTLILQLGAILTTVPNWKKTHRLRIVVFIENEDDMENEKERIQQLIEVLRIKAVIKVVCLNDFKNYNTIVKGKNYSFLEVDQVLHDDEWWVELKDARLQQKNKSSNINMPAINIASPYVVESLPNKRYGISKLQKMGLSFSMTTNRLLANDVAKAVWTDSDSSDNESNYSEIDFRQKRDRTLQTLKRANTEGSKTDDQSITSINSSKSILRNPGLVAPTPRNVSMNTLNSTLNSTLAKAKKNQRPYFSSEKIPKSQVIDDASGDQPSIMLIPDEAKKSRSIGHISKSKFKADIPQTAAPVQVDESEIDIDELSFNDLPAKAQHLILNDVMKTISKDVEVIFSTLPAPVVGTHYSEYDCKEYMENLQVWTDGLPPIMLINSQSMTVTTAL
jgi:potassium/chloride transporter 9